MRWLMERIRAALCTLQATHQQPARVGVLNTGELVLIDGQGQPMVFSTDTTDLMRDALQADTNAVFIDLTRGAVGATD